MSNKDALLKDLTLLDLSTEEATVYLELLGELSTHLKIARATGLHRMKVYRIVEQLEKRGLVRRQTDDRGTFIVADRPVALEMEQAVQEEQLKHRKAVLAQLVPKLSQMYDKDDQPFSIRTYTGVEGFKQMVWHELRTEGELLVFGNSTLEQVVDDSRWSNKLRRLTIERGYKIREIYNNPFDFSDYTTDEKYMDLYEARIVPHDELPMQTPMVIYNDTVEVYQFKDGLRVGAEIINKEYATTMRNIFEHYWRIGKEVS